MSIVSIVGNPKRGGRTTEVAFGVAERLARVAPDPRIEVIELSDLGPALLGWGDPGVAAAVEAVQSADALVVASPTYKASYTGLLKLFLDQVGSGALGGILTVPVMLGGSAVHSLAVDTQLRPVLVELGAAMPTAAVYHLDSEMDRLSEILDVWWADAGPVVGRYLGTGS